MNASSSEVARVVQEVVASVLSIGIPDADTNLIGLGANSMELIRIINKLEEDLGVRLNFEDVDGAPTVAVLVDAIERRSTSQTHSELAPTERRQTHAPVNASVSIHPEQRESASAERSALFRKQHQALRKSHSHAVYRLDAGPVVPAAAHSLREYAPGRLQRRLLEQLLGRLQLDVRHGELRARYASAGALFPVQVYVYIKNGRVEAFPSGLFYYHPTQHELHLLASQLVISHELYEPVLNAPTFERAAFAIYFVSRPSAIEPIYGTHSRDFCLIETGSMAQVLREAGHDLGVGLCPMGELKFASIRNWFDLESEQECLYSFVGGACPQGEVLEAERRAPNGEGSTSSDVDVEKLFQSLRIR